MKNCSVESCKNNAIARGWCGTHWRRWRVYGNPNTKLTRSKCNVPGCDKKHNAKGFCYRHFAQYRRETGYTQAKERGPKYRYTSSLRYAESRGLDWSIGFQDYCDIILQKCHYCLKENKSTRVGLDRKNNDVGYTIENVVSCCRYCNQLKSNIFEYEDFLEFSKTDLFKKVLDKLTRQLECSVKSSIKNTDSIAQYAILRVKDK